MFVNKRFFRGFAVGAALFVVCFNMPVDAAQIWNTPDSREYEPVERVKPSQNQYFNAPNNNTGRIEKKSYYNRPDSRYSSDYTGKFKSDIRDISKREQYESKQYAFMHPTAVKNRKEDTDLALKREYNRSQELVKFQKQGDIENENADTRAAFAHQKRVAEYINDREGIKEAQKREKKKAYYALVGAASGNGRGSARTASPKINQNKYGLKKPKKLFNDPNL